MIHIGLNNIREKGEFIMEFFQRRSEQEMMNLILSVAKEDDRIKAVLLSGSRANPDSLKDRYQDYDITYFVDDVLPFYHNMEWITQKFGRPIIVQMPELMEYPALPPERDGHFTYLMIFEDGNRMDLSFDFRPYMDDGEPAIVLLDKTGFLPKITVKPDYWYPDPPKASYYANVCNEFWWCLNNVAKGIARDELSYAKEMFDHYVRDMLNQMTDWYIGGKTEFTVSTGKMGKYFKKYLPTQLYEEYKKTYSDGSYEHFWEAVFIMCHLFRTLAKKVAEQFSFTYNEEEDTNMMWYLTLIRREWEQDRKKER